jgi:hypothetical protein
MGVVEKGLELIPFIVKLAGDTKRQALSKSMTV